MFGTNTGSGPRSKTADRRDSSPGGMSLGTADSPSCRRGSLANTVLQRLGYVLGEPMRSEINSITNSVNSHESRKSSIPNDTKKPEGYLQPFDMSKWPSHKEYKMALAEVAEGKAELLTPMEYMDKLQVRVNYWLLVIDYWWLIMVTF